MLPPNQPVSPPFPSGAPAKKGQRLAGIILLILGVVSFAAAIGLVVWVNTGSGFDFESTGFLTFTALFPCGIGVLLLIGGTIILLIPRRRSVQQQYVQYPSPVGAPQFFSPPGFPQYPLQPGASQSPPLQPDGPPSSQGEDAR
jgi:hypothetical protein